MFERNTKALSEIKFMGMEYARAMAEKMDKTAKLRFKSFISELNKLNIDGKYLDVGSGTGILATMIAENNKNVHITALDISPEMTVIAKENITRKNLDSRISLTTKDIEDSKVSDELGDYDLIYSTSTLHFWQNPVNVLSTLTRLLKDNGVIIISDLRRVWWLYWVPVNHVFFNSIRTAYTTNEIREILEQAGMVDYEIKILPPFFEQIVIIRNTKA